MVLVSHCEEGTVNLFDFVEADESFGDVSVCPPPDAVDSVYHVPQSVFAAKLSSAAWRRGGGQLGPGLRSSISSLGGLVREPTTSRWIESTPRWKRERPVVPR